MFRRVGMPLAGFVAGFTACDLIPITGAGILPFGVAVGLLAGALVIATLGMIDLWVTP